MCPEVSEDVVLVFSKITVIMVFILFLLILSSYKNIMYARF